MNYEKISNDSSSCGCGKKLLYSKNEIIKHKNLKKENENPLYLRNIQAGI
jgi:hypothetical protein